MDKDVEALRHSKSDLSAFPLHILFQHVGFLDWMEKQMFTKIMDFFYFQGLVWQWSDLLPRKVHWLRRSSLLQIGLQEKEKVNEKACLLGQAKEGINEKLI